MNIRDYRAIVYRLNPLSFLHYQGHLRPADEGLVNQWQNPARVVCKRDLVNNQIVTLKIKIKTFFFPC